MAHKLAQPLHALSVVELKTKIDEARRELFGLRLTSVTSPVKDNSMFKKLRKEIARAMTILRSKELVS